MQLDSGASRSVWLDGTELPLATSLTGNISADVCVVGAGIAGLTTAYLLSREGVKVVVIDDGPLCGGETGRTTAHLANDIAGDFATLLSRAEACGVADRVARVNRNPDMKGAQWLLARHHKTRDHFKPPDYGAQRHSRVEIAFNFSREQGQAGVTVEHNAQLPEPSE